MDREFETRSLKEQQLIRFNPNNILVLPADIKHHASVMSIYSPVNISTHVTDDFGVILNSIKDLDELFKFISFQLPSYYSNVLKLYGSESASLKLQNEIDKEREAYDLNYSLKDASQEHL